VVSVCRLNPQELATYLLSYFMVVLLWFDVCWCYVVVWLWWCGIRIQAESSGACDLFVQLFHGLYCPGSNVCWYYVVV